MRFFGKNYVRENTPADAKSDHTGDYLERAIAAALPQVVKDQRAMQQAKAAEAKRQRAEDRAVAQQFGIKSEEPDVHNGNY